LKINFVLSNSWISECAASITILLKIHGRLKSRMTFLASISTTNNLSESDVSELYVSKIAIEPSSLIAV